MMKYGLKWMLLAAAGILLSAQRSEAAYDGSGTLVTHDLVVEGMA